MDKTELKFGATGRRSAAKQTLNVTIDRTKRYQKIIGFGGSFTDATGYNIRNLPQKLQDSLVSDYFAKTGLEYNLNRLPIGGSDFSTHPYSYDDNNTGDFELKHWNLTADDYNYKVAINLNNFNTLYTYNLLCV